MIQLKKIAFISYEFPPGTGKGGIGTYIKQTATAMARNMVVHVFAGSNEQNFTEYIDGYYVHYTLCSNVDEFRQKVLIVFEQFHVAEPFDLIESPEINGNAWEIKKKYPNLPLIVRLHAPNYLVEHLKKKYIPFLTKLRFVAGAFRRLKWDLGYWRKYTKETDPDYQFVLLADYITAPSIAMKEWAIKNWDISSEKIVVLPNIFLPSNTLLQIPISNDNSHHQIVFFGRLNVLKGLVNATKAMKKILQEYPLWQFKVIGDDGNGPNAGVSMRYWMKQHLRSVINKVQFLDGVDYEALPEQLADASIVLLPSLFESFSYTCAEAMAAGKAIVGSKNGGMSTLLQHEKTGVLVCPESVSEIYTALKRLITDNEAMRRIGFDARESILTDFNAANTAKQFKCFYQTITN